MMSETEEYQYFSGDFSKPLCSDCDSNALEDISASQVPATTEPENAPVKDGGFVETATQWIKENPLQAAGAALALYYLFNSK